MTNIRYANCDTGQHSQFLRCFSLNMFAILEKQEWKNELSGGNVLKTKLDIVEGNFIFHRKSMIQLISGDNELLLKIFFKNMLCVP